ncbi:unnamed protein product [Rotaria magnacalcarata]|uniref:Uncharacterized protein n=1 Tax=Rotaria magnacalcarata TaxID=392030 RepID=A0A816TU76_9BILA|nr:unnamed protein product [Rotaria magnacalcarata]
MASANKPVKNTMFTKTQTVSLQRSIEQQFRPLVLRLTNREKSKREMSIEECEEVLQKNLADFEGDMNLQIEQLTKSVKSCRPKDKQDVNYEKDRRVYEQLVKFVTRIFENMHGLVKTIFDRHRLFVHEVWHALHNGKDCDRLHEQLQADIQKSIDQWEQYINDIEEKIGGYFKIMDDSVFADNFCDRITNLGTIYSNIAESATNSDSELDRLDNELDCAAADLETELHNQLEEYVNGVKSKKPHNAKPNDPEYEAYKSTIQKATAEVKRTTNWLSKIFSKIRDMIGKIIDKIKKKASDTVDWITKWFKNIFK